MPRDRLRRSARGGADGPVREGPPPGVGRLHWYETGVLGRKLAVLHHPERGTVTTTVQLHSDSIGTLLAGGGARLHRLLGGLAQAPTPLCRLQVLADDGQPGRGRRVHLVAALPLTRATAADARAISDVPGAGLALIAGRATLELARRLADVELSIQGFLDTADLAELIRSRYDPGPLPSPGSAPWPAEIDATDHRRLRTIAVRQVSWHHATAWVKAWPTTPAGVDLSALLDLQGPKLPRAAAVTAAFQPGQEPTVAGYLTVSAPAEAELRQARAELRRVLTADSPLQLEWTDREHHLSFVHTLPLATGLAAAPAEAPATARTPGLAGVGRWR